MFQGFLRIMICRILIMLYLSFPILVYALHLSLFTAENQTTSHFLIHNHIAYPLNDSAEIDAIKSLGFLTIHDVTAKRLNELEYKPALALNFASSDSMMAKLIKLSTALFGKMHLSYTKIPSLVSLRDPSTLDFPNRYLVVEAYPGHPGHEADILMYWLPLPFDERSVPGQNYDIEPYYITPDGKEIQPEDTRIIRVNSSHVHIVYSVHFTIHYLRCVVTGAADLKYNKETDKFEIVNSIILATDEVGLHEDRTDNPCTTEKNWSPFLMNGEVHYITHVNPLTIAKVADPQPPIVAELGNRNRLVKVVSKDNPFLPSNVNDSEGGSEFRGGSNAINISEHRYLSFYHVVRHFNDTSYRTYFFGAYVFSTASLPYRVVEVSSLPIIVPEWYIGKPYGVYGIDYITFPASVFLTDDELTLTICKDNAEGIVLKFKLQTILASLSKVKYASSHEFNTII
jgi:hypothetical protein